MCPAYSHNIRRAEPACPAAIYPREYTASTRARNTNNLCYTGSNTAYTGGKITRANGAAIWGNESGT